MDILLVDDDDVCLTALSLMLKKKGLTVYKAKSAKQAKALISSQSFDIIFTDMGLPDVEQYELVQYLCDLTPAIPIVVISGHILEESAQMLRNMGVIQLLEKPIYAKQVQDLVTQLNAQGLRTKT